jgi:hypothetical protein
MKIRLLIIWYAYLNLFREWLDLLDSKKRKIFNDRLEICLKCNYRDPKFNLCSICKCPLKPKTRGDYNFDEEGKSIFGCPKLFW